jgi:hypothetical protein
MHVETVSTSDHSLLHGVRDTLARAEHALLCVAFIHARGVHLVEKELTELSRRGTARMVVTTTFDSTNGAALAVAAGLGARVRTLNPGSGRTYHPKVYLGWRGDSVQAVVGSANLTGGLAANVEVGVLMRGSMRDPALAKLTAWADDVWGDARGEDWMAAAADSGGDDELEGDLLDALSREVARNPVFLTLGKRAPNRVTDLTRSEVLVETEASRRKRGGSESIPAWMLNIAWEYVHKQGTLTNKVLLEELRVHRSSAVCALLARLPGLQPIGGGVVGVKLG